MPLQRDVKAALMYAASEPLARSLGQLPRREGNVIRVPSRTRSGLDHTIRIGIDGAMACNCEAGMNILECWALKYAREELHLMTTETALVPVPVNPPKALIPSKGELASIKETAAMALAGAISLPEGIKTKEQAAALMLYGWELGLPPMTSLQKLYIVKGRVSPSSEVMAGLVMRHEPDIRLLVEELTDKVCTMRIQRPSRKLSETYTVTWDEIIKAGLQGGANANYPRDRLRYHCTKRLLRIYCPDLINNLDGPVINAAATLDDEDKDAIEGDYRPALPAAPEPSTPEQRREVGAYWSHASDAKRAAATERWPHVFPKPGPGVMNQLARLTQQDADEVLAFFQDVTPVETGPASEQGPESPPPPANVGEGLADPDDLPWDAPEAAEGQDVASTQQPATKRTPTQLLTAIGKTHGNGRALAARAIMPMHFGTMDPSKLTAEAAADYAALLAVWLDDPDHSHEEDVRLLADERAVCNRCGVEVKLQGAAST